MAAPKKYATRYNKPLQEEEKKEIIPETPEEIKEDKAIEETPAQEEEPILGQQAEYIIEGQDVTIEFKSDRAYTYDGIVTLNPGINTITTDEYKILAESSLFKKQYEAGIIRVK